MDRYSTQDTVAREIGRLSMSWNKEMYSWLDVAYVWCVGDGFDIREFHEEILRLGPVPMHVLELALYEWIRTEAGRSCASDAFTLSSALVAIALMFCWIYCQLLAWTEAVTNVYKRFKNLSVI